MKDVIFIKPKKFEDTKRIVNYIVADKILHINLTKADTKTYQRVLDFMSGAMYLKEAKLINPSEKIFLSIPKDITFEYDGEKEKKKSDVLDLRYNEEEEIKPVF